MGKQNDLEHHQITNFWAGLALGTMVTGGVFLLFGTKKGRKITKRLLELSENWEEGFIQMTENVSEELLEKLPQTVKTAVRNEKKNHSIGSLLNKIKTLSPLAEKKTVKKFFVKDGKIT
ncbi:hypothetical protein GYA28_02835 [Candidatus Roizmanbacteria bacterium]|jgi:hypothetical protein|nr:hypothetical protein [Candidatus Roizmanbacteria bacterium]